jgi:hypothetical protein
MGGRLVHVEISGVEISSPPATLGILDLPGPESSATGEPAGNLRPDIMRPT